MVKITLTISVCSLSRVFRTLLHTRQIEIKKFQHICAWLLSSGSYHPFRLATLLSEDVYVCIMDFSLRIVYGRDRFVFSFRVRSWYSNVAFYISPTQLLSYPMFLAKQIQHFPNLLSISLFFFLHLLFLADRRRPPYLLNFYHFFRFLPYFLVAAVYLCLHLTKEKKCYHCSLRATHIYSSSSF